MSSPARWLPGAAREAAPHPARRAGARGLGFLTCLVVATAPVEDWIAAIHPELPKLPSALLVLAWAAWRLRLGSWPTPRAGSVGLAAMATVVLAGAAVHAGTPFTATSAVRWIAFIVVTYVLLDLFCTVVEPRTAAVAFVIGALVAGLAAIAVFATSAAPRAAGPIGDPNDLAYTLGAAAPLALLLGRRDRSPGRVGTRAAVLQAVSVAVLVTGAALTLSRGAVLGLVAAVVVVLACRPRLVTTRTLTLLGVIVVVGGAVLVATSADHLTRSLEAKSYVADANVSARADRWAAAVEMIGRSPLLGVGPGGFRSEYDRALDAAEPSPAAGVAHQMYLETGAELGVVGLGIFLALCAGAVVSNERARRRGDRVELRTALHAALAAVLVTSFFLSEQYFLPLWFMIALGLSSGNGRGADVRGGR